MDRYDAPPRRGRSAPPPRPGAGMIGRLLAVSSLVLVIGVVLAIILGSGGGGHATSSTVSSTIVSSSTTTQRTTPRAVTAAAVPILVYNVINTQPPGSTLPPSLYVPTADFSAQMQALKSAGFHPITLDQLAAYWSGRRSVNKPIVITFDGGYASQYANALPALRQLGWVGVADLPLNLLPSAEGGLSDPQVRALSSAGWELDAMSPTQTDLTTANAATAQTDLASARQSISSTYNVPVNWLAYSLGKYSATESAAAKAAGFTGALTGVPGWANPARNRFALARVVVSGGTSAQQLIAQIAGDETAAAPPAASG